MAGARVKGLLNSVRYSTTPVQPDAERSSARRLLILRELASDDLVHAPNPDAVCLAAASVLNEHTAHLPFTLFYLAEADGRAMRLVATSGVASTDFESLPSEVHAALWPLERVLHAGRPELMEALPAELGGSPPTSRDGSSSDTGICNVPRAIVLPLGRTGSIKGALVCGVATGIEFDSSHRSFLELVALQVTAALGNVELLRETQERSRAAEVSLFSFFMQVPVPICVLRGPDLVFEAANPPMCQVLGRDTLVGRTFDEAFPELHDQGAAGRRFSEIFRGVMATGSTFEHHELPVTIARNGRAEQAYFNAVFAPIVSTNGSIDRVVAVGVEVTSEVRGRVHAEQAQEELELTSAALRAASALRDDFLTVASHELRTPLTTLGLQVDGLLLALHHATPTNAPVPKLIEKTNKLRSQADRLESLIEGMLDVFNLDSNNLHLQVMEVDLADAARSVVSRLALEFRSIHIELRPETCLGMWDRARLEQVIAALVSNALKFGAGRPIEVGVGGSATTARVWVKDRGIGIDAADQQRIFERFVRAAPSSQYAGFGLGLWIVQEIVKAMGGQVSVLSQLGAGSTFTIDLPRSP